MRWTALRQKELTDGYGQQNCRKSEGLQRIGY